VADDHDEGYRGPAILSVDGRDLPVQVVLDARHEPHDGRLRWFGRATLATAADPDLHRALATATSRIELRVGDEHRAAARIGDIDPWGRYRVTGLGTPPFPFDEPPLEGD
jgi:Domain of unknown function (DUF4873)